MKLLGYFSNSVRWLGGGHVSTRYTIILGDCVTGMRNLTPASLDFMRTDPPPYLVDYQSCDGRKVATAPSIPM